MIKPAAVCRKHNKHLLFVLCTLKVCCCFFFLFFSCPPVDVPVVFVNTDRAKCLKLSLGVCPYFKMTALLSHLDSWNHILLEEYTVNIKYGHQITVFAKAVLPESRSV